MLFHLYIYSKHLVIIENKFIQTVHAFNEYQSTNCLLLDVITAVIHNLHKNECFHQVKEGTDNEDQAWEKLQ